MPSDGLSSVQTPFTAMTSMLTKAFSLTLILAILVNTVDCDRHKIVEKSLMQSGVECGQYNPQEHCMTRCQTLLTRDWSDATGMRSVYDRFFQPNPVDGCSFNRTQRCLNVKLSQVPLEKKCCRASESIQCYLDHSGQVMMDVPRYVRASRLQERQILQECAAMLGFSEHQMLDYSLTVSRCLLRCFMIRSGLYSDSEGLNLERFYVACGGYDDESYGNITQCIASVRASSTCDRCSLAYRLLVECIGSQYDVKDITFNQHNTNVGAVNNYNTIYLVNIDDKLLDSVRKILPIVP